jgi:hypothetical protein
MPSRKSWKRRTRALPTRQPAPGNSIPHLRDSGPTATASDRDASGALQPLSTPPGTSSSG